MTTTITSLRRAAIAGHARLLTRSSALVGRSGSGERGQTTVEYALLMLGVAGVAGLLLAWVRGTDLFEKLFDRVLKSITP